MDYRYMSKMFFSDNENPKWCWPLCFIKFTVNAAIFQEILEHCMLPFADKLYRDADFIFQQDWAPVHTAKRTKISSLRIMLHLDVMSEHCLTAASCLHVLFLNKSL